MTMSWLLIHQWGDNTAECLCSPVTILSVYIKAAVSVLLLQSVCSYSVFETGSSSDGDEAWSWAIAFKKERPQSRVSWHLWKRNYCWKNSKKNGSRGEEDIVDKKSLSCLLLPVFTCLTINLPSVSLLHKCSVFLLCGRGSEEMESHGRWRSCEQGWLRRGQQLIWI